MLAFACAASMRRKHLLVDQHAGRSDNGETTTRVFPTHDKMRGRLCVLRQKEPSAALFSFEGAPLLQIKSKITKQK
jgi:hypothetical protein